MLGSLLFRSSSFRNSLFSQVAMHSLFMFMVWLSTSSLSWDLFLAGQASAAKGHSIRWASLRALTGSLKKTCCTFVGGGWEPDKKLRRQRMRFHRWTLAAGWEPDKKGENLSDIPHLAQGFFVWMSFRSHGGRMPVDLNVADKMRTDRQCYFKFIESDIDIHY